MKCVNSVDVTSIKKIKDELMKHQFKHTYIAKRAVADTSFLQNLQIGQIISDKAFVNATLDNPTNLLSKQIEIVIPKGTKGRAVMDIAANPEDLELLLPPGTQFKVIALPTEKSSLRISVIGVIESNADQIRLKKFEKVAESEVESLSPAAKALDEAKEQGRSVLYTAGDKNKPTLVHRRVKKLIEEGYELEAIEKNIKEWAKWRPNSVEGFIESVVAKATKEVTEKQLKDAMKLGAIDEALKLTRLYYADVKSRKVVGETPPPSSSVKEKLAAQKLRREKDTIEEEAIEDVRDSILYSEDTTAKVFSYKKINEAEKQLNKIEINTQQRKLLEREDIVKYLNGEKVEIKNPKKFFEEVKEARDILLSSRLAKSVSVYVKIKDKNVKPGNTFTTDSLMKGSIRTPKDEKGVSYFRIDLPSGIAARAVGDNVLLPPNYKFTIAARIDLGERQDFTVVVDKLEAFDDIQVEYAKNFIVKEIPELKKEIDDGLKKGLSVEELTNKIVVANADKFESLKDIKFTADFADLKHAAELRISKEVAKRKDEIEFEQNPVVVSLNNITNNWIEKKVRKEAEDRLKDDDKISVDSSKFMFRLWAQKAEEIKKKISEIDDPKLRIRVSAKIKDRIFIEGNVLRKKIIKEWEEEIAAARNGDVKGKVLEALEDTASYFLGKRSGDELLSNLEMATQELLGIQTKVVGEIVRKYLLTDKLKERSKKEVKKWDYSVKRKSKGIEAGLEKPPFAWIKPARSKEELEFDDPEFDFTEKQLDELLDFFGHETLTRKSPLYGIYNDYTYNTHAVFNLFLRGYWQKQRTPEEGYGKFENTKALETLYDHLYKQKIKKSVVVTRNFNFWGGLGPSSAKASSQIKKLHSLKVGDTFTDDAIVSTSLRPATKESIPTSVEIEIPEGTRGRYLGDVALNKWPLELVLPPNTKFEVIRQATKDLPMKVRVVQQEYITDLVEYATRNFAKEVSKENWFIEKVENLAAKGIAIEEIQQRVLSSKIIQEHLYGDIGETVNWSGKPFKKSLFEGRIKSKIKEVAEATSARRSLEKKEQIKEEAEIQKPKEEAPTAVPSSGFAPIQFQGADKLAKWVKEEPGEKRKIGDYYYEMTDGEFNKIKEHFKYQDELSADMRSTLRGYTLATFGRINGFLRKGTSPLNSVALARKMAKLLYSTKLQNDYIVSRVLSPDMRMSFAKRYEGKKVGDVIQDDGVISTSLGKIDPSEVNVGMSYVEIEVPKGTLGRFVSDYSTHEKQLELLLAPGTKFEILKLGKVTKLRVVGINKSVVESRVGDLNLVKNPIFKKDEPKKVKGEKLTRLADEKVEGFGVGIFKLSDKNGKVSEYSGDKEWGDYKKEVIKPVVEHFEKHQPLDPDFVALAREADDRYSTRDWNDWLFGDMDFLHRGLQESMDIHQSRLIASKTKRNYVVYGFHKELKVEVEGVKEGEIFTSGMFHTGRLGRATDERLETIVATEIEIPEGMKALFVPSVQDGRLTMMLPVGTKYQVIKKSKNSAVLRVVGFDEDKYKELVKDSIARQHEYGMRTTLGGGVHKRLLNVVEEASIKESLDEVAEVKFEPLFPWLKDWSKHDISNNRLEEIVKEFDHSKTLPPKVELAIRSYTAEGFKFINSYLRGLHNSLGAHFRERAEVLSKFLDGEVIKKNVLVSRDYKMFHRSHSVNFKDLKKGDTFTDSGFSSTSLQTVEESKIKTSVEIEIPAGSAGRFIGDVSKHPAEVEVLLPPGTKFEVIREATKDLPMRVRVVGVEKIGGIREEAAKQFGKRIHYPERDIAKPSILQTKVEDLIFNKKETDKAKIEKVIDEYVTEKLSSFPAINKFLKNTELPDGDTLQLRKIIEESFRTEAKKIVSPYLSFHFPTPKVKVAKAQKEKIVEKLNEKKPAKEKEKFVPAAVDENKINEEVLAEAAERLLEVYSLKEIKLFSKAVREQFDPGSLEAGKPKYAAWIAKEVEDFNLEKFYKGDFRLQDPFNELLPMKLVKLLGQKYNPGKNVTKHFSYTDIGDHYKPINNFLRGKKPGLSKKLLKDIEVVNEFLKTQTFNQTVTVSRRINYSGGKTTYKTIYGKDVQVGDVFTDRAFLSTEIKQKELNPEEVNIAEFVDIEIPPGQKAWLASRVSFEDFQVILPPGTHLEVVSLPTKTSPLKLRVIGLDDYPDLKTYAAESFELKSGLVKETGDRLAEIKAKITKEKLAAGSGFENDDVVSEKIINGVAERIGIPAKDVTILTQVLSETGEKVLGRMTKERKIELSNPKLSLFTHEVIHKLKAENVIPKSEMSAMSRAGFKLAKTNKEVKARLESKGSDGKDIYIGEVKEEEAAAVFAEWFIHSSNAQRMKMLGKELPFLERIVEFFKEAIDKILVIFGSSEAKARLFLRRLAKREIDTTPSGKKATKEKLAHSKERKEELIAAKTDEKTEAEKVQEPFTPVVFEGANELNKFDKKEAAVGEYFYKITDENFEKIKGEFKYQEKLSGDALEIIDDYSYSGFDKVNDFLRNGEQKELGIAKARKLANILYSSQLQKDYIVSRVLSPRLKESFEMIYEGKKVGDVITDTGVISTSLGRIPPKNVWKRMGYVEIEVPKGSYGRFIGDVSSHPKQLELLLAPGAKFEILSVGKITKLRLVGFNKEIIEEKVGPLLLDRKDVFASAVVFEKGPPLTKLDPPPDYGADISFATKFDPFADTPDEKWFKEVLAPIASVFRKDNPAPKDPESIIFYNNPGKYQYEIAGFLRGNRDNLSSGAIKELEDWLREFDKIKPSTTSHTIHADYMQLLKYQISERNVGDVFNYEGIISGRLGSRAKESDKVNIEIPAGQKFVFSGDIKKGYAQILPIHMPPWMKLQIVDKSKPPTFRVVGADPEYVRKKIEVHKAKRESDALERAKAKPIPAMNNKKEFDTSPTPEAAEKIKEFFEYFGETLPLWALEPVKRFTDATFATKINNFLREKEVNGILSHSEIRIIENLQAAARQTKAPGSFTTTRVFDEHYQLTLGNLKVGDVFNDKGLVSTTFRKMEDVEVDKRIEIEIPDGTNGVYIGGVDSKDFNYEFLLPSDTQFRVIAEATKTTPMKVRVVGYDREKLEYNADRLSDERKKYGIEKKRFEAERAIIAAEKEKTSAEKVAKDSEEKLEKLVVEVNKKTAAEQAARKAAEKEAAKAAAQAKAAQHAAQQAEEAKKIKELAEKQVKEAEAKLKASKKEVKGELDENFGRKLEVVENAEKIKSTTPSAVGYLAKAQRNTEEAVSRFKTLSSANVVKFHTDEIIERKFGDGQTNKQLTEKEAIEIERPLNSINSDEFDEDTIGFFERYATDDFDVINAMMRGNIDFGKIPNEEIFFTAIDRIRKQLLTNQIQKDIIVTRRMRVRKGDLLEGDTLTPDSFFSTSVLPNNAPIFKEFDARNAVGEEWEDVFVKIKIPKGTPGRAIMDISDNWHEAEVLLPPGLQLKVTSQNPYIPKVKGKDDPTKEIWFDVAGLRSLKSVPEEILYEKGRKQILEKRSTELKQEVKDKIDEIALQIENNDPNEITTRAVLALIDKDSEKIKNAGVIKAEDLHAAYLEGLEVEIQKYAKSKYKKVEEVKEDFFVPNKGFDKPIFDFLDDNLGKIGTPSQLTPSQLHAVSEIFKTKRIPTKEISEMAVRYSSLLYENVNKYMRGQALTLGVFTKTDIEKLEEFIRHLRAQEIPEDILVSRNFRFMGEKGIKEIYGSLKVGDTFEDAGISSVSLHSHKSHTDKNDVVEIEVPKGTRGQYIGDVAVNPEELEILLAPGTKYEVIREATKDLPMRVRVVDQQKLGEYKLDAAREAGKRTLYKKGDITSVSFIEKKVEKMLKDGYLISEIQAKISSIAKAKISEVPGFVKTLKLNANGDKKLEGYLVSSAKLGAASEAFKIMHKMSSFKKQIEKEKVDKELDAEFEKEFGDKKYLDVFTKIQNGDDLVPSEIADKIKKFVGQDIKIPSEVLEAFGRYGTSGYDGMNKYLRGFDIPDKLPDIETINILKNFLEKQEVGRDVTVIRALGYTSDKASERLENLVKKYFGDLKVGDTFSDKGFVSTSFSKNITSGSQRTINSQVEIQVPKGTKGFYYSQPGLRSEYELILAPNTEFEVISLATATRPLVVRVINQTRIDTPEKDKFVENLLGVKAKLKTATRVVSTLIFEKKVVPPEAHKKVKELEKEVEKLESQLSKFK